MCRVMLADDAMFMRTIERNIVENAGYEVVVEERGKVNFAPLSYSS